MSDMIVRYWQVGVAFLVIGSLVADVLAKKQFPWVAFAIGVLTAAGWVLLLQAKTPFGRAITLNDVGCYVTTVIFATLFFGETMTVSQWVGLACGVVAIALLA